MINSDTIPNGEHQAVNSDFMSEHLIRLERLSSFANQQKWNDRQLSEQIGRKPAQISAWRNGTRTIGEKIARDIEERLKLPRFFLDERPGAAPSGPVVAEPARAYPPPFERFHGLKRQDTKSPPAVPILKRAQLSLITEENMGAELVDVPRFLPRSADISSKAKAFIVDDLSMSPDYLPGDIVVLDPCVQHRAGDVVLIETQRGDLLLRRFRVHSGSIWEAAPSNHLAYNTLRSDTDDIEVVAVVIEHTRLRSP